MFRLTYAVLKKYLNYRAFFINLDTFILEFIISLAIDIYNNKHEFQLKKIILKSKHAAIYINSPHFR